MLWYKTRSCFIFVFNNETSAECIKVSAKLHSPILSLFIIELQSNCGLPFSFVRGAAIICYVLAFADCLMQTRPFSFLFNCYNFYIVVKKKQLVNLYILLLCIVWTVNEKCKHMNNNLSTCLTIFVWSVKSDRDSTKRSVRICIVFYFQWKNTSDDIVNYWFI